MQRRSLADKSGIAKMVAILNYNQPAVTTKDDGGNDSGDVDHRDR
jgi:hypothetical protein